MSRTILTMLLASVALMAALTGPAQAQTGEAAAPETVPETVPETETACVDSGGRWDRGGLAGQLLCFLPTPDAGQACATGEDCAGFCLAETGTCSAETPMFGCLGIVDLDGAEVTICID